MTTTSTPESSPEGGVSLPLDGSSRARRRSLLRLVAGGAPLLSASPVAANIAASSAWRAAREDAKARPAMVTSSMDGWIRSRIDIVELQLKQTTSTTTTTSTTDPAASTLQAYKLGGSSPVYYQVGSLMQVNSLMVQEVKTLGQAYALMLFDSGGGIVGVDPSRQLGYGIQGLHCSSWRSISPTGTAFPGCSGV